MPLQEEFEIQGNWLFRYRSFLPLVILLLGAAVYGFTAAGIDPFGLDRYRGQTRYELICLMVSLCGSLVRIYTVAHAPDKTSGRNTSEGQIAESLNTTGIYSTVRHPLYVGNFLMWLGVCLLTANAWFVAIFCLIYALYYERIMYAEEQFLRNKFSGQYLPWASRVPAFFPALSGFKSPAYPFSWKKVLRSEKSSTVNLFVVFCLFDFLGETVRPDVESRNEYLLLLLALSLSAYLVIKVIEKTTRLLSAD